MGNARTADDDFLAVYRGPWMLVGGPPLELVGIERDGRLEPVARPQAAVPARAAEKVTPARALPKPGFDAREYERRYAAEMAQYGIVIPRMYDDK